MAKKMVSKYMFGKQGNDDEDDEENDEDEEEIKENDIVTEDEDSKWFCYPV